MMLCERCQADVACEAHGEAPVEGFTSETMGSRFYSCEECLRESGSAFASVVHECGAPLRMIPRGQKDTIDPGELDGG